MPLPAALAPFSDPNRVRTPWPLVLGAGEPRPLIDLIEDSAQGLGARLIGDNLLRLEGALREGTEETPRERVRAAGERMRAQMGLHEGPDATLRDELDSLQALMPEGRLLDYAPRSALALLQAAARQRVLPLRAALTEELHRVRLELARLIEVEERHEQPSNGGMLGRFLNPSGFAALAPDRGSVAMDAGRRERLEGLVQDLVIAGPPFIVVQSPQQACEVAAARFDVAARDLARCLGALRAARLELSGAWDEARHGPLFADFSWQDFGPDEAQLLPVVLVVQSADLLASRDLPALSRLLASGRPVHVLAEQVPTRNPGLGADEDPLAGHRLDLGVVAFGLGQVFVQQGTPARHEELWAGFQAALASPSPALHLVFSGWFDGDDPELGGWLTASAAVQSRAQPLFRHDPRGDSWAGSMDVTGNPEPESDWAEGFSFQDFALLDPALAHHFTPDESGTVATEGGPLRASEALVLASADRRRAWLRLRELGGVANEHALAAATAALDAARATADAERKELAALHDAELQRLRADSARDAIQKLASALVDGRLGAPVARPPQRMVAAPTAPAPVAVPVPAVAETAPPEAAAEEEPEEAWIDSELCTSCNDCVEINPLLFVYDANKQATLGDLSQGTHKELVLAAEKCPSSCIYPGSP